MAESMLWSIYLDTSSYVDDWVDDYNAKGVPDGVYDVYFPYIETVGKGCGVIVQDGMFVREPTLKAVRDARDMVGYWGVYIEDLVWDEDEKAFQVSIGS